MSEDDEEIWRAVTETIKPIKRKSPVIPPSPKIIKKPVTPRAAPIPIAKPTITSSPNPLPPKRVKQLKQQKIPIERSIDLHGFTVENAHHAVINFISRAKQQNLRCVEIITGRGNPDRGTGQLRRFVPFWLDDLKAGGTILHIELNPASRGGSFLVLLRRNRGID